MQKIALALVFVFATATVASAAPRNVWVGSPYGYSHQAPLSDSIRVPSANGF